MSGSALDGRRLAVVVSVVAVVASLALAVLRSEPAIAVATARLEADRDALRSNEIAFATSAASERERRRLRARLLERASMPDTELMRVLDTIARRRGVRVLSTAFRRDDDRPSPAGSADADDRFFTTENAVLTLRGRYPALLAAVSDLSAGSLIVRVDRPSLQRDEPLVVATVPVTIYRPSEGPR